MESLFAQAGSVGYAFFMFALLLGIIVFIHELGHYLVARYHDIHVEEFAIGFGKEVFGWNDKNNTRWKICLVPLGGYIKMLAEEDHIPSTGKKTKDEAPKEPAEIPHNSMLAKTPWQKIQVSYAGPLFNYILTFVCVFLLATLFGMRVPNNQGVKIIDIVKNGAADNSQLQVNDIVVGMNDQKIPNNKTFYKVFAQVKADKNTLDIMRDKQPMRLEVMLKKSGARWKLGVMLEETYDKKTVGPVQAIKAAFDFCVNYTVLYVQLVGSMIKERNGDNLSGPVGIAQSAGKIKITDFEQILNFIAVLSLSLGFFNLLPIPPLDGGNSLVYFAEMAIGREYSEKIHYFLSLIGIALVLMIMVYSLGNDLLRLFN